ncbi:MAG: VWA domain-containing protein [bacterium]|nr:VWA domain-containing protein [bacterium]
MKSICKRIRSLLATEGPRALRGDAAAEEHLVDCPECLTLLETMSELDEVFAAMPAHDAPDEVVDALLARDELRTQVQEVEESDESPWRRWLVGVAATFKNLQKTRRHWRVIAVPVVLFFGCVVVFQMSDLGLQNQRLPADKTLVRVPVQTHSIEPQQEPSETDHSSPGDSQKLMRQMRSGSGRRVAVPDPSPPEPEIILEYNESSGFIDQSRIEESKEELARKLADSPNKRKDRQNLIDREGGREVISEEIVFDGEDIILYDGIPPPPEPTPSRPIIVREDNLVLGVPDASPPPEPGVRHRPSSKMKRNKPAADEFRTKSEDLGLDRKLADERERFKGQVGALKQQITEFEKLGESEEVVMLREQLSTLNGALNEMDADAASAPLVGGKKDKTRAIETGDRTQARTFLTERNSVEGQSFREPRGYWSNTYVPGDRELRRLESRLATHDRSQLESLVGTELQLHDASKPAPQPFDAPDDSAIAVYLRSDRRGLNNRQRLLLEIGLKGSQRRAGTRPAMNVGVVLDLRGEVTDEVAAALRALVGALSRSHDLGDRFNLVVAGRPGGLIVPAERFRHGPLMIAMNDLLQSEIPHDTGLSLTQAVESAIETVTAEDDPNTPIGSSLVLVVTSQSFDAAAPRLTQLAHTSSVAGVPVSVVGIGKGVRLDEIDTLVLAGQGNRRLLTNATEAEQLIERELEAVSQVIARALRLRIRLAAGIQLVDVIGSSRLGEARAQQVRDAENAIDRRLAHNLGITSDRGLDEEGIQIVIPTFYAGDEHVILLDLVAPGPGPIADVSARYKDLVWLRNGVSSANFSLGRDSAKPGPLQRNVLKNLLSHKLGEALGQAADLFATNQIGDAAQRLSQFRQLLIELSQEIPEFESDPDLNADIALLDEYLSLLGFDINRLTDERDHILDSLRYAARLQIIHRPITASN